MITLFNEMSKYKYYLSSYNGIVPTNAEKIYHNDIFSLYLIPSDALTIATFDNYCSSSNHKNFMEFKVDQFIENKISEEKMDIIYESFKDIKSMIDLILSNPNFRKTERYKKYLRIKNMDKFNI